MMLFGLFVVSFIGAFLAIELIWGMLLTMFYTPSLSGQKVTTLQIQEVFGYINVIAYLVTSLISLGIAITILQLSKRKLKIQ